MAKGLPHRRGRHTTATVIIYFQRYPGIDIVSGISNIPYTIKVDGNIISTGQTNAAGRIMFRFDRTKTALIEVLGSKYEIRVQRTIEPINVLRGIQKRFNMLGYNVGNVDGINGRNTEREILNFQADNAPLRVDGLLGTQTRRSLRNKVGE